MYLCHQRHGGNHVGGGVRYYNRRTVNMSPLFKLGLKLLYVGKSYIHLRSGGI